MVLINSFFFYIDLFFIDKTCMSKYMAKIKAIFGLGNLEVHISFRNSNYTFLIIEYATNQIMILPGVWRSGLSLPNVKCVLIK